MAWSTTRLVSGVSPCSREQLATDLSRPQTAGGMCPILRRRGPPQAQAGPCRQASDSDRFHAQDGQAMYMRGDGHKSEARVVTCPRAAALHRCGGRDRVASSMLVRLVVAACALAARSCVELGRAMTTRPARARSTQRLGVVRRDALARQCHDHCLRSRGARAETRAVHRGRVRACHARGHGVEAVTSDGQRDRGTRLRRGGQASWLSLQVTPRPLASGPLRRPRRSSSASMAARRSSISAHEAPASQDTRVGGRILSGVTICSMRRRR